MAHPPQNPLLILLFITCSLIYSSSSPLDDSINNGGGVKAAYWPSHRVSYSPPSSINTDLFTHIFYAFAHLNNQTFEVGVPSTDDPAEFTSTLLTKKPSLKTLLSIGGGGSSPTAFALMASNASHRKVFINSAVALARKYGFHGLDLDWEFPKNAVEMENLGTLFSEWRHAIDLEATASGRPRILLTAAVYFAQYPATSIAGNLDLG